MTVAVTTALLSQSAVAAIGGLVSCAVLFILVLLCVCGDSGKRNQSEVADTGISEYVEPNSVVIKVEPTTSPLQNGQAPEQGSRNSYRSSGSSPQPGGQRELPAPPTASLNSSVHTPEEEEDQDYDHLTTTNKNTAKRASNYDHIKVSPEGKVEVEEHKNTEHFYSEVKSKKSNGEIKTELPSASDKTFTEEEDGDYDTLNDGTEDIVEEKRTSVVKVKSAEDPYSRLKEEDSGGSFTDIDPYSNVKDDPYSKVKDDPYSKVKDDPYSRLKDEVESDSGQSFNPYSKVKEDPYSKMKDDPPYSRMKDDPYSRVKDDDPYNKMEDDIDSNSQVDDPYNKVNENNMEGSASGTTSVIDAYASVEPKITRKGQEVTNNTRVSRNGEDFSVVENSSNEYAVVMKSRSESTPTPTLQNPFNFQTQDNDPYMLPPEPPRRYNEPDDAVLNSQRSSGQVDSQRSSLVQTSSQRSSAVHNAVDVVSPDQPGAAIVGASDTIQQNVQKREPPYHKITARESLASINQRMARNTYETVAETEAQHQTETATFPLLETENFYATVDGGSGDGVVTNRGNRDNQSPVGDHYAEIGATGGRLSSVPAPPSLDSLHIMTKSAEGKLPNGSVSPKGDNSIHKRNLSDQGRVTLDPDYQTVRDCINDVAASSDPNYESVQEVESKATFDVVTTKNGTRLIRDHFYEEVKPASEAETVKKRVLRGHQYEDIDDIKEQKKQYDDKAEEVWKRRSGADRL